ncbi:hypothetical protein JCM19236_3808 [Vibrio sp. JCM 19236]|nr:hypothetical protein JCM19236_3808 [Vibrio sp. JCM 19236]
MYRIESSPLQATHTTKIAADARTGVPVGFFYNSINTAVSLPFGGGAWR